MKKKLTKGLQDREHIQNVLFEQGMRNLSHKRIISQPEFNSDSMAKAHSPSVN